MRSWCSLPNTDPMLKRCKISHATTFVMYQFNYLLHFTEAAKSWVVCRHLAVTDATLQYNFFFISKWLRVIDTL